MRQVSGHLTFRFGDSAEHAYLNRAAAFGRMGRIEWDILKDLAEWDDHYWLSMLVYGEYPPPAPWVPEVDQEPPPLTDEQRVEVYRAGLMSQVFGEKPGKAERSKLWGMPVCVNSRLKPGEAWIVAPPRFWQTGSLC